MMNLSDKEYEALVNASKQPTRTTTWGAAFAEAMAKCQGAIETAQRDRSVKVDSKTGPGYVFKYATLSSVMDVVRQPLAANGLAVVQEPAVDAQRASVTLRTTVMHSSGEYLQQALTLPAQRMDPQGLGAVISYARRYAILSILGVATDDDDEEHLAQRKGAAVPAAPARQPYTPPAVKSEPRPATHIEDTPPPPAEPEVPGPWQPTEADKLAARIAEAQDVVTLKALVKELGALPEHQKQALRKAYNARSKELAGQAVTP